jgi:hypothetical protein
MMLGMYAASCFFVVLGVDRLFGSVYGPYAAAFLFCPIIFAAGYPVYRTQISRIGATRTAQLEGERHGTQLILTLGIALDWIARPSPAMTLIVKRPSAS